MITRRRGATALAAIVAIAFIVLGVSLSTRSGQRAVVDGAAIKASKTLGATRGPNGEQPTPASALQLTAGEVGKLRAGHHTAAFVWHENADFTTAVTAGASDEFARLGIEVIAQTNANFDAAKQEADVETVAAQRPSVLLTLPVDPVVTASAFKAVADQGTKLVLLSIVPQGLRRGRDYVNVVTDDLFEMGSRAADALAAAVGNKGTVGYFFRDANSYVANQRDLAFLKTITRNYPDVKVVVKQGIADPTRTQDEANAVLLRNPDLSGVYVTYSQPPAEGVLAALRANANTTTKIVSLDLDEPLALDMARGGNTFALIADQAYEIGRAMAKSAAYGLLGKEAPAFVIVPAMTITKSNLVQGYHESLHRGPPASVMTALGK